ncbi:hypothetical protein FGO68_gene5739 [Halteria grandinella]|uniref:Uncharacterized protein n=1 Tax=Halteria grandinella TaxID=5974 RepID=A0A8J8SX89_HALGN|nr:hypothetical protein FGO68_gene5739 [Halteria grandinella]
MIIFGGQKHFAFDSITSRSPPKDILNSLLILNFERLSMHRNLLYAFWSIFRMYNFYTYTIFESFLKLKPKESSRFAFNILSLYDQNYFKARSQLLVK